MFQTKRKIGRCSQTFAADTGRVTSATFGLEHDRHGAGLPRISLPNVLQPLVLEDKVGKAVV